MIPYIGNKYTLSDFILPNCPKNPDFWVEPFGGMMGVFFNLNLKEYPDTQFIYNDINPLNSNLLEQLKKDKFIEKILKTKVNKEIFIESYDNLNSRSKVSKAYSWLIILCCGDLRDLMSQEYKGDFNFEMLKYKIPRYTEYFKRLTILNLDFKKVLEKYDSENTFFYLDPPYMGYEGYYTNHNFKHDSHLELHDRLIELKAIWALSYYDFPQLKEWYKDFKMIYKKHNLGTEWLIIKLHHTLHS